MKFNVKHFAIFALIAFVAMWLGGQLTTIIPELGNPWLNAGVAFVITILPFYAIWMYWGKKQAAEA